jgi:hypothetical protein
VVKKSRINWFNGLLLPVLVALILVGVGLLRGYLHRQAGFDADGRPIVPGDKSPDGKNVPTPVARPWIGPADMLQAMVSDLDKAAAADRPHYRYLTLVHRHNDKHCSAEELKAEGEEVREVVDALALRGRTPSPPTVDAHGVILRLDLRKLGWVADPDWRDILVQNPYGLTYETSTEIRLVDLQEKLRTATTEQVPYVRGDWLVVALSRLPLSAKLLGGKAGSKLLEHYKQQTLSLETAATDLGLTSSEGLRSKLAKEAYLRQEFGLAPLLEGKTIPRSWWETDENLTSPYQELSKVLGLGKPYRLR